MAGRSNAKKVRLDGFIFDSGAEARRYQELRLMQAGGVVRDIEVHPAYPIEVNDILICKYEADFRYWQKVDACNGERWVWVVEDVKGQVTDVFRLKAKLFEAIYRMGLLITPASLYRAPRARTARRRARR